MYPETYTTIILFTILLHIVNIIISILLLKDSDFKSGFILIIISLSVICFIQVSNFIETDISKLAIVYINPFELISFIGSIILFFILIIFLLTKKYETSKPKKENTYFYKPSYDFHEPEIFPVAGKSFAEPKVSEKLKTAEPFIKRDLTKVEEAPAHKAEKQAKVETAEHVKEIPSNGKAVVAKFIKKEEPRSELDKMKEELEKVKFQRDKLVSIISHDLRTPLNSVFGYCQLLKDGQYKNKKEVEQFAENIFELSKQQLNALNKIIEWTRYESPSLTLNPAEFDVTSTINFVVKSMTKIAEQKNIRIIVNSRPDLYVYGDEFMIIEVLKNLLDNAIKFSHPSGSIEIHTHYHEKLNKLVVLIVDSGIGIDREILMNLLVSTKKFTTKGTKGEKGLGLGLLIVRAIIDKHGEHFWIASEEGKWTRVYFTLKPAKISSES